MIFDRSRLTIRSAADRKSRVRFLERPGTTNVATIDSDEFRRVVAWLRERSGPKIWFLGGHVIKANLSIYLGNLMQMGLIDHIALNGAGLVHDWELNRIGHTSENVEEAIKDGSFGLWSEIGELNDLIVRAAKDGLGIGAAACAAVTDGVLGAASALGIPVTVHVAIGQDVFFEHPNCNGSAWGAAGYHDFLAFADAVENLQGGILLSFGSAVAAPEIFLKSLAMARNVRAGKPDDLAIAVFDCVKPPSDPDDCYFNRPAKTLLGRITNNAAFVHARHEDSIPAIWKEFA